MCGNATYQSGRTLGRGLKNRTTFSSRASLALSSVHPQKSRSVVVQDVAFLLRRQVIGVLNDANRIRHQFGPEQLVGSEHHAVLESGIYESRDVTIDLLDRIAPDESRNVDVNMGVRLQQGEHVVDHGITSVHHLNTQFRMARQEFLKQKRIPHGATEFWHGDVCPS